MIPTFPTPWRDFVVPIFGGRVIAYKSRQRFVSVVRATGGPDDPDMMTCRGMCYPTQNDEGARLYTVGWFDGDIQTLVHETGHLTLFVLGHAGIDPKDSDGETMCYVLDAMFSGLYYGKLKT